MRCGPDPVPASSGLRALAFGTRSGEETLRFRRQRSMSPVHQQPAGPRDRPRRRRHRSLRVNISSPMRARCTVPGSLPCEVYERPDCSRTLRGLSFRFTFSGCSYRRAYPLQPCAVCPPLDRGVDEWPCTVVTMHPPYAPRASVSSVAHQHAERRRSLHRRHSTLAHRAQAGPLRGRRTDDDRAAPQVTASLAVEVRPPQAVMQQSMSGDAVSARHRLNRFRSKVCTCSKSYRGNVGATRSQNASSVSPASSISMTIFGSSPR